MVSLVPAAHITMQPANDRYHAHALTICSSTCSWSKLSFRLLTALSSAGVFLRDFFVCLSAAAVAPSPFAAASFLLRARGFGAAAARSEAARRSVWSALRGRPRFGAAAASSASADEPSATVSAASAGDAAFLAAATAAAVHLERLQRPGAGTAMLCDCENGNSRRPGCRKSASGAAAIADADQSISGTSTHSWV